LSAVFWGEANANAADCVCIGQRTTLDVIVGGVNVGGNFASFGLGVPKSGSCAFSVVSFAKPNAQLALSHWLGLAWLGLAWQEYDMFNTPFLY